MRLLGLVASAFCAAACAARTGPIDAAALRLDLHGHRVERVGRTLYAFGGYPAGESRATARTWAFELPHGPWRPRAAMNRPRAFFGSAVIGGELYAIGVTIERYDPAADRWQVVGESPDLPKSHFGAAGVGGRIHVVGGFPSERAGHLVFDPVTGRIERAPPPPGFAPGDHLHVVAAVRDRLHVIGGLADDGLRAEHFVYVGNRWRVGAPAPSPLLSKFAAIAPVGERLYVFSMQASAVYDASADRWRPVAALPTELVMPCAVALDRRIVVLGGRPVDDAAPGTYVYDRRTDRWTPPRDGSSNGLSPAR